MRMKRTTTALMALATCVGALTVATPAQAAPLQWVTMNTTQALCNNALMWKLQEFRRNGATVHGITYCRFTWQGWEAAIRYN